jgi:hypothetical protein
MERKRVLIIGGVGVIVSMLASIAFWRAQDDQSGKVSDTVKTEKPREEKREYDRDEIAKNILGLCESFGYTEADEVESFKVLQDLMERGFSEPTPLADGVLALWKAREYESAVRLADDRLKGDQDDLLGLLIKLEVSKLFVDIDAYVDFSIRVLERTKKIDSKHFKPLRPLLVMQIENSITTGVLRSSEDLAKLREKSEFLRVKNGAPGPPFSTMFQLQALELDGQFKDGTAGI